MGALGSVKSVRIASKVVVNSRRQDVKMDVGRHTLLLLLNSLRGTLGLGFLRHVDGNVRSRDGSIDGQRGDRRSNEVRDPESRV